MSIMKGRLEVAPLLVATKVTYGAVLLTNAIGHSMGRLARRRGMSADEAAVRWEITLGAAESILAGDDLVRAEIHER